MKHYRWLVNCALALALVVIMLGAYTRLTDAGLGCPDWPGCYGFLSVPVTAEHMEQASARFPSETVEVHKAWNEMIHRYCAGLLGLLILVIALVPWGSKTTLPKALPAALLLLVLGQAMLGMLTVTMNLQPLIVMGHLLGGFTLFSLLFLLRLRLQNPVLFRPNNVTVAHHSLFYFTLAALVMVILQIALGGWLAANYAAAHCTGLPFCNGPWQEQYSFWQMFHLPQGHASYEYGVLSSEARLSIHLTHRIFAVIVTALLLGLTTVLWQKNQKQPRALAVLISSLVMMQLGLGVALIWFTFPVWLAVLHNQNALFLLNSLVLTGYWCFKQMEVAHVTRAHNTALA